MLETVQKLKEGVADAIEHDKKDEAVKKHEEIIALIEAALRHDQAQPWMYEILALSMKAAGRPQEDIDRAIMSAAEFTPEPGRPDVPRRLLDADQHGSSGVADFPSGCPGRTALARTLLPRHDGRPQAA